MNNQHRSQTRQFRHRVTKVFFRYVRKLINPRMNQKTFEAEDSSLEQWRKVACVARHEPAPETDVDVALITRRRQLRLKTNKSCCGRNAVERHIDECRHTTRCRRARCCRET